jgi:magnesium transporter
MKLIKKRLKKTGLPPGTLTIADDKIPQKSKITVFHYNENNIEEKTLDNFSSDEFNTIESLYWVNVDGLSDIQSIQTIGTVFGIHILSLEDILNTNQRPKCEDYDDYIFLVLKMIIYNETQKEIDIEQVSFIITENAALTFQEKTGDVFNPIRERLRKGKGRIRKRKANYLVYCLIDVIVDHYFEVLEHIGEDIENLEDEIIENPAAETSSKMHSLRRKVLLLRRSIRPLREVINNLMKLESSLIEDDTRLFLRDLNDHIIQIIESMETFRDMLAGLFDMYLSSSGNKMNEIMKVLTIISTIFIPLSFIAGLYGMNFKKMPELEFSFGYPIVICVMIGIVLGFIAFFKRKKWI